MFVRRAWHCRQVRGAHSFVVPFAQEEDTHNEFSDVERYGIVEVAGEADVMFLDLCVGDWVACHVSVFSSCNRCVPAVLLLSQLLSPWYDLRG